MKKIKVHGDRAVIKGEPYRALLLQVMERDPDGTARVFRLLRDDEEMHLQGGEAFEIVFGREALHRRQH